LTECGCRHLSALERSRRSHDHNLLLPARFQAVERRARAPALAPPPAVEPAAEATTSPPPVQVPRVVTVLPTALVQNTDDPARLVVYSARDAGQGFPPLVGRAIAP
jgi:hypothetical protein